MLKIAFFSTVRIYRKRFLSNKISYCVCELLPFCAFSFVRYTQRYQLRLQPLPTLEAFVDCRYDLLRPVEKHTTKQNGHPGGFCSSVKKLSLLPFRRLPNEQKLFADICKKDNVAYRPVGSSRNVRRPAKKIFCSLHSHHTFITNYFNISMHAIIAINVATENDTLETFRGLAVSHDVVYKYYGVKRPK